MRTKHAWFSAATALRLGSEVYRKSGGGVVNVTRLSDESPPKSSLYDERYLGEVISTEDGGRIREMRRVPGITDR